MVVTVCDFCRKQMDTVSPGVQFEHGGKTYRVDISVYHNQNGVRAKRTDACAECTLAFAKSAAREILDSEGDTNE